MTHYGQGYSEGLEFVRALTAMIGGTAAQSAKTTTDATARARLEGVDAVCQEIVAQIDRQRAWILATEGGQPS